MDVDMYAATTESQQQREIRSLLLNWRDEMARKMGITPDQINYCARNSMILHDIYIDAITEAAPSIRCLDDFCRAVYYWRLLDQHGAELYQLIQNYLDTRKRLCGDGGHLGKRVRCS